MFAAAQHQVSDIFVGDFAASDAFSVAQYMKNPRGRVLVLDYPSRQAETVGPLFTFLLDRSIALGMDDLTQRAFYLLDEVEHMSIPLSRLGALINVERGVNCQAIISLQSVAQLYDTYGENRGHALLSDMTTSIILRCADAESVEFARATIGTHFEEYTAHTERESIPGGGSITIARETRLHEEHDFAAGDFYKFDPGSVVAR